MKVCAIQMEIKEGDRKANYATVSRMAEVAAERPAVPDVIVLPELWSTGYALKSARELAAADGDADFLAGLAAKFNIAFAGGSVLALQDGKIYNRGQVIDKSGTTIAGYDKIHLFRLMGEDRYLAPGKNIVSFDLYGVRCGMVICYDIRFCELVRKLALAGVEVLFVSAEWPLARKEHWLTLLRARAIENQMFVVSCNRCGTNGHETFAGNSLIVAPDGAVLAQADEREAIIESEIDPRLVSQVRGTIPVFKDRVPELYFCN